MEERKVLCHFCREKFPKSQLSNYSSSKRICSSCLEKVENEPKDYAELIDYICKGYNQKRPTGKQIADIKKFKNSGLTYKEIQWTIYYLEGIKGRRLKGSLGLIPYYVQEALEHFERANRLSESLKNVEMIKETEVIEVANRKTNDKNRLKTRVVDISVL